MARATARPSDDGQPAAAAGVYGITVAARMVGTGVQNLRAYERAGLVAPSRTDGGTRLYSADDISRLRRVLDLLEKGLNLAGISMVIRLEAENHALRRARPQVRSRSESIPPSTASMIPVVDDAAGSTR